VGLTADLLREVRQSGWVTPKPLWVHFVANFSYAFVIGGLMAVMGDLRTHWWLAGSVAWGLVATPITRRWERRGSERA
jgi:hypothetical protein